MKEKSIEQDVARLYEYLKHKTLTRTPNNTYSVSCFIDGVYHQMIQQALGWKKKRTNRVVNECVLRHKNVKLIPGGLKLVL